MNIYQKINSFEKNHKGVAPTKEMLHRAHCVTDKFLTYFDTTVDIGKRGDIEIIAKNKDFSISCVVNNESSGINDDFNIEILSNNNNNNIVTLVNKIIDSIIYK